MPQITRHDDEHDMFGRWFQFYIENTSAVLSQISHFHLLLHILWVWVLFKIRISCIKACIIDSKTHASQIMANAREIYLGYTRHSFTSNHTLIV